MTTTQFSSDQFSFGHISSRFFSSNIMHGHHIMTTFKRTIAHRIVLMSCLLFLIAEVLPAQIQVLRQRASAVALQSVEDFDESASLFELTLRNAGTTAVQLRVGVELTVNNATVLQSVLARMPIITLQPGESRVFLAHDVFRDGAVAGRTLTDVPTFPIAGNYVPCFQVVNVNGTSIIPRTCITRDVEPANISIEQARNQIRKILGFDVTIGTIARNDNDGSFTLSGRLTIPSNNLFTVPANRTVNFTNVTIPLEQMLVPGTTDYDPVGGQVRLVETELQLNYNGWLPVTLRNAQGLTVRRETSLTGRPGTIREPMFINMNTLLTQVPNSGVTGDVRLQLALGETLASGGSNIVPAVISTGQLTIARGLTIDNASDARWRIKGLDIGQLQNPSVLVSPDSLRVTAQFPLTIEGFDISAFTIDYVFRRVGGYDDRVRTSQTVKIGDRIIIRFNEGDISNAGFTFSGAMTLNAKGFTSPITFNIANIAFVRNNNQWTMGVSNFKYQRAEAGKISLYANNDVDFTFASTKEKNETIFSITGRGTFGLGLPRGFQVGVPVSMKFDSKGVVEATMTQRIQFGVPHNKSSNRNSSGQTNGDATSAVKVEINSITYNSENQKVSVDGSITMGLPRGVEFEAGNFGFDKNGLASGYAKILLRFQKGVKGGGGLSYERGDDKTRWGGSFDVSVDRGSKGEVGIGAEFTYAASDDWGLKLKASKVPGIQLSVSPPVWIEEIRGQIANAEGRWSFGLGAKFVALTPSNQTFGAPGIDINADGVFRIGGDGPTQLDITGTVDVRGFGFGTRVGNGTLIINFTDVRMTGTVTAGFNFLGVVTADGIVNLDINVPASQFFIGASISYNILNAARANGSFWLAKDYTVQAGSIRFVRTGFHADFSQRLIDWSGGLNLGIASFSAYARAGYFWEIDINSNGVGGRLQADFDAGGSVSIVGIGASGTAKFKIDGQFAYGNNNFTMDASAQGRVEVSAGSSRCSAGCNDWKTCKWWIGLGVNIRVCLGIGARARYNRGFSIDVGRR